MVDPPLLQRKGLRLVPPHHPRPQLKPIGVINATHLWGVGKWLVERPKGESSGRSLLASPPKRKFRVSGAGVGGVSVAHLGPKAGVACCSSASCDTIVGTVERGTVSAFGSTCSESSVACVSWMSVEVGGGSAMARVMLWERER